MENVKKSLRHKHSEDMQIKTKKAKDSQHSVLLENSRRYTATEMFREETFASVQSRTRPTYTLTHFESTL